MDVEQEAHHFADEIATVLTAVLPGPFPVPRVLILEDQRVVIRAIQEGTDTKPAKIPMFIRGKPVADLTVTFSWCTDGTNTYLAVDRSAFVLTAATRVPLLRCEYVRASHTAPSAHWQIHAERGSFSQLLATAGHATPHELASLHLPVGGTRYRPCLEDFLQFAIQECGVDKIDGWQDVLADGRERWRRRQARTIARDAPDDAATALRELGYAVTDPPDGPPLPNLRALRAW